MRIAIIGAGRVGRALGGRISVVGHDVVYGVRDPSDDRHADLAGRAAVADAVAGADLAVLALPWDAVEPVLASVDLQGVTLVDATNPLAVGARELAGHPERCGAEIVAAWAPGARVVKAFNTTGAANLADPTYEAGTPMMPVAGDDDDAKAAVLELATDLGFDAVDAGPLANARELEHLALLWIRLAYALGNGPDFAFAVLRR